MSGARRAVVSAGLAAVLTAALAWGVWSWAPWLWPRLFPTPHPAWRARLFARKHAWFEAELIPDLRARVRHALRATG